MCLISILLIFVILPDSVQASKQKAESEYMIQQMAPPYYGMPMQMNQYPDYNQNQMMLMQQQQPSYFQVQAQQSQIRPVSLAQVNQNQNTVQEAQKLKDNKLSTQSLIQTAASTKNQNPTTGLIDLSESDDESQQTSVKLNVKNETLQNKTESNNHKAKVNETDIDQPPTEEIKSLLSEENMRSHEHKKHADAIKSRIQQLEQQINEEEKKTEQLKDQQKSLASQSTGSKVLQEGIETPMSIPEFSMQQQYPNVNATVSAPVAQQISELNNDIKLEKKKATIKKLKAEQSVIEQRLKNTKQEVQQKIKESEAEQKSAKKMALQKEKVEDKLRKQAAIQAENEEMKQQKQKAVRQEILQDKKAKQMAIMSEKEDELGSLSVDNSGVKSKIDEVIEHHDKIGRVLEGLKEELAKPKECKPDTRGWDNIVSFFSGPQGGHKAEKVLQFLGMLQSMEQPPN